MKKVIPFVLLCCLILSCVAAGATEYDLGDFQKLYLTFYVYPGDSIAKSNVKDFLFFGDFEYDIDHEEANGVYFKAFEYFKQEMEKMGFVLVDNPRDADAIGAFRLHVSNWDPITGHQARSGSFRVIDYDSKDTLYIVYTTPPMVTRSLKGEAKELLKNIKKKLK